MSRRTVAGLIAFGLIVVLATVALTRPVPYVTFSPGPTLNVLGPYDGKQIIAISGRQTYADTGALRMVTVYPTGPDQKLTIVDALLGWVNPDVAVLPRDAVYKKNETNQTAQATSRIEMTSSQDDATAAALTALGIKYRLAIVISTVDPYGASAGVLRKGDLLLAVNGVGATDPNDLVGKIRSLKPGSRVQLTIRRQGVQRVVAVTTRAAADDPTSSRINVGIQGGQYVFPFSVKVQLPETIGGPSAGLVFALTIYDLLTPGSLTGGQVIAGSGEISPDGTVGPIGGIGEKLPAAQRDGARLFLVAAANCAEAAKAHYDPAKMRLVKVQNLKGAIAAVEAWRANPNADLPRCS